MQTYIQTNAFEHLSILVPGGLKLQTSMLRENLMLFWHQKMIFDLLVNFTIDFNDLFDTVFNQLNTLNLLY